MAEERHRTRFNCPKCDHLIVTMPEHQHISGDLICPGCGVTVEPPNRGSLMEKTAQAFAAIFKSRNDGQGSGGGR